MPSWQSARRVLFLGAGGAVRAVAYAIAMQSAPACVTILGRSPEKVGTLAADLHRDTAVAIGTGSLGDDLPRLMASHNIIIQGTPVGMYGHDETRSPVPPELLRPEHVVFDMVYRPRQTVLLRDAAQAGCKTFPGSDMLLNQAVIQFETWMGIPAPVEAMRQALESALNPGGSLPKT